MSLVLPFAAPLRLMRAASSPPVVDNWTLEKPDLGGGAGPHVVTLSMTVRAGRGFAMFHSGHSSRYSIAATIAGDDMSLVETAINSSDSRAVTAFYIEEVSSDATQVEVTFAASPFSTEGFLCLEFDGPVVFVDSDTFVRPDAALPHQFGTTGITTINPALIVGHCHTGNSAGTASGNVGFDLIDADASVRWYGYTTDPGPWTNEIMSWTGTSNRRSTAAQMAFESGSPPPTPTKPDYFPFPDEIAAYIPTLETDNVNGTDVFDLVGNNEATLSNVTWDSADKERLGEHSLIFNGTDSFVELDSLIYNETQPFSLSFWIRTSEAHASNPGTIFAEGNANEEASVWVSVQNGVIVYDELPGSTTSITGSIRIDDDQWHHVLVSRLNQFRQIWIDGVLDNQVILDHSYTGGPLERATIGARPGTGGSTIDQFQGKIDPARFLTSFLNNEASVGEIYGQQRLSGPYTAIAGTATTNFVAELPTPVFTILGQADVNFVGADLRKSDFAIAGQATTNFVGADVRAGTFAIAGQAIATFVSQEGASSFTIAGAATTDFRAEPAARASFAIEGKATANFAGADLRKAVFAIDGQADVNFVGADLRKTDFAIEGEATTIFIGATGGAKFTISGVADALFIPETAATFAIAGKATTYFESDLIPADTVTIRNAHIKLAAARSHLKRAELRSALAP